MEPIEVVAKFQCNRETRTAGGSREYTLHAVSGDTNKEWSKYTPAGTLTILIDNPAAQIFEPGQSYILRFSHCLAAK